MNARISNEASQSPEQHKAGHRTYVRVLEAAVIGLLTAFVLASTGELVWGFAYRSGESSWAVNAVLAASAWTCFIWVCIRTRTRWQRKERGG